MLGRGVQALVRLAVVLVGLLWTTVAVAGPTLVVVDEDGMDLPSALGGGRTPSAVDPVWFLLAARRGARPQVRAGTVKEGCAALLSGEAERLVAVRVRWRAQRPAGSVRTVPVPRVTVEDRAVEGGRCVRHRVLKSPRQVRAFEGVSGESRGLAYTAERELEEALSDVLWRHPEAAAVSVPSDPLPEPQRVIPVRLVGDEEYRERYGEGWVDKAEARVQLANQILAETGLRLRVVGSSEWESPDGSSDPYDITLSLETVRFAHPDTVLVAFTAQTRIEHMVFEDKVLGAAARSGHVGVLVADAAIFEGDDPAWDAMGEALTLVHELFHYLGVGHVAQPGHLMSADMTWTRRIQPGTLRMARASAELRFGPGSLNRRLEAYLRSDPLMEHARGEIYWAFAHLSDHDRRPACLGPYGNLGMVWLFLEAASRGDADPDLRDAWRIAAGAHATAATADPVTRGPAEAVLDAGGEDGRAIDAALVRAGLGREALADPDLADPRGCPLDVDP